MSCKRRWTKEEVRKLYQYSEQISQKEAAGRLGRTHRSIRDKSRLLGINWFQGFMTFQDIANSAGCNYKQVKRFVSTHMKEGVPGRGEGSGFRARIPLEDADEIVARLRKMYPQKFDV